MQQHSKSQIFLAIYALLAALEAGICFAYTLSIPTDPKNSVLLGFSAQRLAMMGVLLIILLIAMMIAIVSWKSGQRAEKMFGVLFLRASLQPVLLIISGLLFLAGSVLVFVPGYRFYEFQAYYQRLKPLVVWVTLFSFQTLIPLMVVRFGWHPQNLAVRLKLQRVALRVGFLALIVFILLWVLIALTKVGIVPDSMHWNDIGVPILMLQLGVAAAMAFISPGIARRLQSIFAQRTEWLVCALIWLAATAIWFLQPQPGTFFAPGPYSPNNELYPFSDAAGYDISAQRALIGMGYNTPECPDKPFYITLLTWFHLLGGQRYNAVIFWQVVLIALLPVILYLIGKHLHSQTAGFLIAYLIIVKEANAISASLYIRTSHTKLMLSEMPTALMLGLLTLFLILWIKRPGRKPLYAILAGGVLGLSALMRLNTLVLLPILIGFFVLVDVKAWKVWFKSGFLLTAMLVFAMLPWMWRTAVLCNTSVFSFITAPVKGILFQQRYRETKPTPTSSSMSFPPVGYKTASIRLVELPVQIPQRQPENGQIPRVFKGGGAEDKVLGFFPAHFVHNLVANVLMLPTRMTHDDLYHRLKTPGGFWNTLNPWQGGLDAETGFLLFVNLLLIALGIGLGWGRERAGGLAPLAICMGYHLSTALARTSGGRYLVPADWGLLVYYGIGIVECGFWVFSLFSIEGETTASQTRMSPDEKKASVWGPAFAALLIALFAVLVPLNEKFFPPYEKRIPYAKAVEDVFHSNILQQAGFGQDEMLEWLHSPPQLINNWVYPYIYSGRALYPRYFPMNEGIPYRSTAYQTMDYPRLVFQVIGPRLVGTTSVVLPIETPPSEFPNGSDVLVFGCMTEEGYVSAFLVVLLSPEYVAYSRTPQTTLQCPPQKPVCDNNHICR
ncbi:MAG: hypothetical protein HPY45_04525 [Anaerolineae bacterium]|nr:hypothetical protein [Anaerolineae bacterium]